MVANNLDRLSHNKYALLVTYTWGLDPNVARYTSYDNDIQLGDDTFVSDPLMSVDCEAQHGGVADAPYFITQSPLLPLDKMARPFPHAPVQVTIEEIDPEQPLTRRLAFTGRAAKIVKNPSGQRGLVKLTVGGLKMQLVGTVGLPVSVLCPNRFTDKNCCASFEDKVQEGTVNSVSGNRIVAGGLTYSSDHLFRHGWVMVDGLYIDVLQHNSTNTQIFLKQAPPPEWVGATAQFMPGCGKTINDCNFWANIRNFGGIGIKTPDYNPVLETGEG